MTFKVDQIPAVNQQLRALAKRAKALRVLESYLDAIRQIESQLENCPQEWGDPEYRTKHPGGIMYHGSIDPLIVHFVVYESLKIVSLTDVRPFPKSRLDLP